MKVGEKPQKRQRNKKGRKHRSLTQGIQSASIAGIDFLHQTNGEEDDNSGTEAPRSSVRAGNRVSKAFQKRRIKRDYAKDLRKGRETAERTAKAVQETAKKTAAAAKKLAETAAANAHV